MYILNAILNGLPQVLICSKIKTGLFYICLYAQMNLPLYLVPCTDGIKLYKFSIQLTLPTIQAKIVQTSSGPKVNVLEVQEYAYRLVSHLRGRMH